MPERQFTSGEQTTTPEPPSAHPGRDAAVESHPPAGAPDVEAPASDPHAAAGGEPTTVFAARTDDPAAAAPGADGATVPADRVSVGAPAEQVTRSPRMARPFVREPHAPLDPPPPVVEAPAAPAADQGATVRIPSAARVTPADPTEPARSAVGEPSDGPTVRTTTPADPARPAADEQPADDQPTVVVPAVVDGSGADSPEPGHAAAGDPGADAEATQAIRRADAPAPGTATEALGTTPEGEVAGGAGGVPPVAGGEAPPTSGSARPGRRRVLVVAGAALGLLAVLYGGDLALGAGTVPRGVLVAGVPVGGLAVADAEQKLRGELEPRANGPLTVTAGGASSEIDPRTAGLSIDWPATLERAGSQPLNPVTRVASFFTEREVGVSTDTDQAALDSALAGLASIVDRPAAEGSVRFEGATPVPVEPVPGQALDVPAAETVLQREWAFGKPVPLPLTVLPPTTDAQDVATAVDTVAKPAVSAPVVVVGEQDVQGTLSPEAIAGLLSFRADAGTLVPEINIQAATEALEPQLARSETPGRDAALDFSGGRPVVTPSKDGRGVDYQATLKDLLTVLTSTGERKITAVYADQPAELTTDELNNLGITGVIGEFTTRGFAPDSGRNIRRAAQMINGMIVQPGETFSLNKATAPRTAANGFVEAGIISDGHASRGVGGGVSQVATTLYNAAYFAGMVDVEHKEHSFYISRYPAGREATVFGDAIDMRFRNDNPTGVMIQTAWTPQSITVRLFGTKRYDVTSTPGPRTNPTEPEKVKIPDGQPCVASKGAPGFTVTDTRTLREISSGQVRRETRTVKYNPSPIVECDDDDD